jgi:hypothetical protein
VTQQPQSKYQLAPQAFKVPKTIVFSPIGPLNRPWGLCFAELARRPLEFGMEFVAGEAAEQTFNGQTWLADGDLIDQR